jgi:activator of 2-hydroxyglutaryl-CoA dehydratase
MLEEETSAQVVLPRHPQLMGAYGAALMALGLTHVQAQSANHANPKGTFSLC